MIGSSQLQSVLQSLLTDWYIRYSIYLRSCIVKGIILQNYLIMILHKHIPPRYCGRFPRSRMMVYGSVNWYGSQCIQEKKYNYPKFNIKLNNTLIKYLFFNKKYQCTISIEIRFKIFNIN
jgi:hypothetical protein